MTDKGALAHGNFRAREGAREGFHKLESNPEYVHFADICTIANCFQLLLAEWLRRDGSATRLLAADRRKC